MAWSSMRPLPQRFGERFEQSSLLGKCGEHVFGMPLYSDRETQVRPLQGFHDALRRFRRDYQLCAHLVHRLMMTRIYRLPSRAEDLRQMAGARAAPARSVAPIGDLSWPTLNSQENTSCSA